MARTESSSVTVCPRELESSEGGDARSTVVWLRGEHDVSTVAALAETIAETIALDDADLVVDLSGVEFIDAATVGAIIGAREFLRPQSRSLALRSPSTCARRVLDVCGLADLIDPLPVHFTNRPGTAGALGTWVEVPATGSSADAHQQQDNHITTVAGRRGP